MRSTINNLLKSRVYASCFAVTSSTMELTFANSSTVILRNFLQVTCRRPCIRRKRDTEIQRDIQRERERERERENEREREKREGEKEREKGTGRQTDRCAQMPKRRLLHYASLAILRH